MVHRIVWYAAGRDIPPGFEINHENLNKKDNRLDNLELTTRPKNMEHASARNVFAHAPGRTYETRCTKLTPEKVRELRRRAENGESQTHIAKSLGVSQPHVSKILSGENYAWLR